MMNTLSGERVSKYFEDIRLKARKLKQEIGALYLAYRRQDAPWYAKMFALLVVGYALSPVDLIPDFIPVLGYLDDLVLIPLGVAFAVKMIPKDVMEECRIQSKEIFKNFLFYE